MMARSLTTCAQSTCTRVPGPLDSSSTRTTGISVVVCWRSLRMASSWVGMGPVNEFRGVGWRTAMALSALEYCLLANGFVAETWVVIFQSFERAHRSAERRHDFVVAHAAVIGGGFGGRRCPAAHVADGRGLGDGRLLDALASLFELAGLAVGLGGAGGSCGCSGCDNAGLLVRKAGGLRQPFGQRLVLPRRGRGQQLIGLDCELPSRLVRVVLHVQ